MPSWILLLPSQKFKVFYDNRKAMDTQHIPLNVPLSFNQLIDIIKLVKQRLKRMEEHPESCLSWKDIERKIKL